MLADISYHKVVSNSNKVSPKARFQSLNNDLLYFNSRKFAERSNKEWKSKQT